MQGRLSDEQIETVLHREVIGRIGCYADNRVFIVPITYAYKDGCIYGHSSEGMKISMMRKNPRVCFEIDAMTDMTHWQSVVVWGTYEEMTTKDAQDQAMQVLINRMKGLTVSETMRPATRLPDPHPVNAGIKAIAFRIRIAERSGRFESNS
jgi:hypothetical protein